MHMFKNFHKWLEGFLWLKKKKESSDIYLLLSHPQLEWSNFLGLQT